MSTLGLSSAQLATLHEFLMSLDYAILDRDNLAVARVVVYDRGDGSEVVFTASSESPGDDPVWYLNGIANDDE